MVTEKEQCPLSASAAPGTRKETRNERAILGLTVRVRKWELE